MKKFEFKLDALLKIREMKEKQIKTELGEIVKQIAKLNDHSIKLNSDISLAYRSQEQLIENVAGAKMLEFYPIYIEGLKSNIESNNNKIFSLTKRYDAKVQELKDAMADVKIVNKLKDKSFEKYKKHANKVFEQSVEDIMVMRRFKNEHDVEN